MVKRIVAFAGTTKPHSFIHRALRAVAKAAAQLEGVVDLFDGQYLKMRRCAVR